MGPNHKNQQSQAFCTPSLNEDHRVNYIFLWHSCFYIVVSSLPQKIPVVSSFLNPPVRKQVKEDQTKEIKKKESTENVFVSKSNELYFSTLERNIVWLMELWKHLYVYKFFFNCVTKRRRLVSFRSQCKCHGFFIIKTKCVLIICLLITTFLFL